LPIVLAEIVKQPDYFASAIPLVPADLRHFVMWITAEGDFRYRPKKTPCEMLTLSQGGEAAGRLAMLSARVDVFPGAVWGVQSKAKIPVPTSTEAQERVLNALLDSALHDEHRNPLDFVASVAVHGLVLAALIIVPMLFTQVIDLRALQLTYLVAPMPPAAAAPPPPAAAVVQKLAPRKLVPFNPAQLVAPSVIPQRVAMVREPEAAPEVGGGVIGGVAGGTAGGVLNGIIGGTTMPAAPAPVAAAPEKKEKQVLRVGGDVQPPHKLYSPAPKYPALAESAHVHGAVLIEATIDEKGNVVNARAVEGHPLLIPEALRTVMLWRYEPTYLNGVPFPVQMTVTVTFSFAS
jgi:TonB family protein